MGHVTIHCQQKKETNLVLHFLIKIEKFFFLISINKIEKEDEKDEAEEQQEN